VVGSVRDHAEHARIAAHVHQARNGVLSGGAAGTGSGSP